MSQIRKQSIVSSLVVYIGFALGFFNTYLFTKTGGFTREEYGLTGIFIAISNIMFSFANLGTMAYISKFYPYYKDNLPKKKNDMFTWALLISLIGFCFVTIMGFLLKDMVIRKFGQNSPELVKYYFWLYPFGLGLTLYSILECYAWQLKESVFTTFLREVLFRVFTTILILLTFADILSKSKFDAFIKIYSFTYIGIAVVLAIYLIAKEDLHITFNVSIVTKKFFKKIITLVSYVFGGLLLFSIASVFDSIVIASVLKEGLAAVAVFSLAQNIASLLQAPQRSIIASSTAALAQAWKDKDMAKINRIYHRSSINQLIFAVGMFALIWLNFTHGIFTFHLQQGYIDARWVFFFIGLTRVIDMGTGVNAQVIGTSNLWRFEFFTGIILIMFTLPLNYILTKYYLGILGPAVANLFSFTVYNALRYWFLKKKFNLQPFNIKTIYTLLLGVASFYICYFIFDSHHGFLWILIRSIFFLTLYISATLFLNLSPDIIPVWHTLLKRLRLKKEPELL
jgi:O-antigen/teichoic acid export membrane protein